MTQAVIRRFFTGRPGIYSKPGLVGSVVKEKVALGQVISKCFRFPLSV